MKKTALILIGHGSKLPHNKETLDKLAEAIRKDSKFDIVEISVYGKKQPNYSRNNREYSQKRSQKNSYDSCIHCSRGSYQK